MNLVLKLLEKEKEDCYRNICIYNKILKVIGLKGTFHKKTKSKRNAKSKYYCQLITAINILN